MESIQATLLRLKDLANQQARDLGLGGLTFIAYNTKEIRELEIFVDSTPENIDLFVGKGSNSVRRIDRMLQSRRKFWFNLFSALTPNEGWSGNSDGQLLTIKSIACSDPRNHKNVIELNGTTRKFFMPKQEEFVIMADSLTPEQRRTFSKWGMFKGFRSACFSIPLEHINKIEIAPINNSEISLM